MTERLSDVEARIGTVHQLTAVITAMRGIAAARSREARARLEGIRAYAGTIANAIGTALTFLPEAGRAGAAVQRGEAHAVIAICAEQGFAGVFSDRILDAAQRVLPADAPHLSELMLIGDRGLMIAAERGLTAGWSASMIVHAGQMAALAGRIADALYQRLDAGKLSRVTVVHAAPDTSATLRIVEKRLVPFDFQRFPLSPAAAAPLLTLPPPILLNKLVEEYIFAEICEAIMLSFAAENEARMRAMIAARTNVAKTLDGLIARSRQLRQDEITDEIIELAAGAAARQTQI